MNRGFYSFQMCYWHDSNDGNERVESQKRFSGREIKYQRGSTRRFWDNSRQRLVLILRVPMANRGCTEKENKITTRIQTHLTANGASAWEVLELSPVGLLKKATAALPRFPRALCWRPQLTCLSASLCLHWSPWQPLPMQSAHWWKEQVLQGTMGKSSNSPCTSRKWGRKYS